MTKARPAAKQADPKLRAAHAAGDPARPSPEDVEKAAAEVEKYVKDNEAARKEVGRIAKHGRRGRQARELRHGQGPGVPQEVGQGVRRRSRTTEEGQAMTARPPALLAVVGADPVRPPDFDTEIVPVLTKAGCNAGACHGAAAGRGGFRLSLLRRRPGGRLRRHRPRAGRPAGQPGPAGGEPAARKPTGDAPPRRRHALEPDGPGAKRLADWIAAGAPRRRRRAG